MPKLTIKAIRYGQTEIDYRKALLLKRIFKKATHTLTKGKIATFTEIRTNLPKLQSSCATYNIRLSYHFD